MELPGRYHLLIERCGLLQGLQRDELRAFLERAERESFSEGDAILTEGKQFHGVWLLLDGNCEVVKHCGQRSNRLALLEPGAVFGEMSFLEAKPHSATVRALGQVETLRLMQEQFTDLQQHSPGAALKIAMNIVRILSDRLRRMDDWTCELVEQDGNHRRHEEWKDFRSKLYSNLYE